jgi:hypothetical protein
LAKALADKIRHSHLDATIQVESGTWVAAAKLAETVHGREDLTFKVQEGGVGTTAADAKDNLESLALSVDQAVKTALVLQELGYEATIETSRSFKVQPAGPARRFSLRPGKAFAADPAAVLALLRPNDTILVPDLKTGRHVQKQVETWLGQGLASQVKVQAPKKR